MSNSGFKSLGNFTGHIDAISSIMLTEQLTLTNYEEYTKILVNIFLGITELLAKASKTQKVLIRRKLDTLLGDIVFTILTYFEEGNEVSDNERFDIEGIISNISILQGDASGLQLLLNPDTPIYDGKTQTEILSYNYQGFRPVESLTLATLDARDEFLTKGLLLSNFSPIISIEIKFFNTDPSVQAYESRNVGISIPKGLNESVYPEFFTAEIQKWKNTLKYEIKDLTCNAPIDFYIPRTDLVIPGMYSETYIDEMLENEINPFLFYIPRNKDYNCVLKCLQFANSVLRVKGRVSRYLPKNIFHLMSKLDTKTNVLTISEWMKRIEAMKPLYLPKTFYITNDYNELLERNLPALFVFNNHCCVFKVSSPTYTASVANTLFYAPVIYDIETGKDWVTEDCYKHKPTHIGWCYDTQQSLYNNDCEDFSIESYKGIGYKIVYPNSIEISEHTPLPEIVIQVINPEDTTNPFILFLDEIVRRVNSEGQEKIIFRKTLNLPDTAKQMDIFCVKLVGFNDSNYDRYPIVKALLEHTNDSVLDYDIQLKMKGSTVIMLSFKYRGVNFSCGDLAKLSTPGTSLSGMAKEANFHYGKMYVPKSFYDLIDYECNIKDDETKELIKEYLKYDVLTTWEFFHRKNNSYIEMDIPDIVFFISASQKSYYNFIKNYLKEEHKKLFVNGRSSEHIDEIRESIFGGRVFVGKERFVSKTYLKALDNLGMSCFFSIDTSSMTEDEYKNTWYEWSDKINEKVFGKVWMDSCEYTKAHGYIHDKDKCGMCYSTFTGWGEPMEMFYDSLRDRHYVYKFPEVRLDLLDDYIIVIDAVSLYPSACIKEANPCGEYEYVDNIHPETEEILIETISNSEVKGFFCVDVWCPKDLHIAPLPSRNVGGGVDWDLKDKYETWYYSSDLTRAVSVGCKIKRIKKCIIYPEKAEILHEYIKYCFSMKQSTDKYAKPMMYQEFKLDLNGFYGKMGQRPIDTTTLMYRRSRVEFDPTIRDTLEKYARENSITEVAKAGDFLLFTADNLRTYKPNSKGLWVANKYKKSLYKHYKFPYHLNSQCLAESRNIMWDLFEKLDAVRGKCYIYYSDTDSVHIEYKDFEKMMRKNPEGLKGDSIMGDNMFQFSDDYGKDCRVVSSVYPNVKRYAELYFEFKGNSRGVFLNTCWSGVPDVYRRTSDYIANINGVKVIKEVNNRFKRKAIRTVRKDLDMGCFEIISDQSRKVYDSMYEAGVKGKNGYFYPKGYGTELSSCMREVSKICRVLKLRISV